MCIILFTPMFIIDNPLVSNLPTILCTICFFILFILFVDSYNLKLCWTTDATIAVEL